MDFRSAGAQAQPTHVPTQGGAPAVKSGKGDNNKLMRIIGVVLLFAITVLVVALIAVIATSENKGSAQQKFVNDKQYQAVFLTNGQVYFGKVGSISADYIQLNGIYYLTQNTSTDSKGNTVTDGNYTLVKLGCQQIHDPVDEMVIQRSQVSFWENLNNDGKVVTSIKDFQKQNPKGPDCSKVSSQTQASNSSNSGTPQGTTNTTTNKNQ